MKTIIQVHIFIRLFASGCILFGLSHLVVIWPQVMRLKALIEKQKENAEMMGETFNMSSFIPSYAEILIGPTLLLTVGVLAFIGTKGIVRFIIGREQIDALLKLDLPKRPNKTA